MTNLLLDRSDEYTTTEGGSVCNSARENGPCISVAMCPLCTVRQMLMSELWARVAATLQHDGNRTILTDAETGCSLNAWALLAEVSPSAT